MDIAARVFMVTGGASGLGEGVVRRLCAHGAQVLIADTHVAHGEALAAEVGATFVDCDVTDEAQAQAAIAAACQLGPLRGLVNCAGISAASKTVGQHAAHPLALFNRVLQVNLVGSFNMLRLAAEAMCANEPEPGGERGVLISTASVAAYDGQIGQAAYAASKGGIVAMTLPIARDLARHGIRNMSIAPGLFATPMMAAMPQPVQDALAASVPFPSRLGKPADFAKLMVGFQLANGVTALIAVVIGLRSRNGRPFFEAAGLIILSAILFQTIGGWSAWEAAYSSVAGIPTLPMMLAAAIGGTVVGWAGWTAGRRPVRQTVPA